VNQVLLERAMEASIGRPIYGDVERHRVYVRPKSPTTVRLSWRWTLQPASVDAGFSAPVAQHSPTAVLH
jgi:hypothetical protein